MNKRIIRHNFNMVEIMLAVIVIALGLTSTFVLFPVGLNASKDAVAENRISDVGETMMTYIQSHILQQSLLAGSSNDYKFRNLSVLENNLFCDPSSETVKNLVDVPFDFSNLNDTTRLLYGYTLHRLANGVYIYANSTSGTVGSDSIIFAAAIKIYLDRNSDSGFENEFFYSRNGTFQQYSALKSTTGDCINKFLLPIVIEVSWPATLPIEEREKRIFRFEMFNHEYNPGNDDDAKPAGA